jgi:hypothetical protein
MRRRWRLVRVVAATLVAAAAAALASVAANAATGSTVTWWPSWLPSMNDNYLRWLAVSIAAVAGSALLVVRAQRRYDSAAVELAPVQQRLEAWIVARPAEVDRIVRAVVGRRGAGTVGITTAVHGAGGFGKTTVARLVRSDRRVLRRSGGGVFWVTVGRDARRGTLVDKVNDLVRRVDSGRAQPFTDLRQAAEHLAAVLADGPRRLIVLDDVWYEDQLAAFPVAGRCARLVTTRVSSLVAGQAVPVRVDQMSAAQARRVLTADLPALPAASVAALLAETGRWPLLLRLTNRNLVAQAQSERCGSGTPLPRSTMRTLPGTSMSCPRWRCRRTGRDVPSVAAEPGSWTSPMAPGRRCWKASRDSSVLRRSRPVAPGWPPPTTTDRCGSGMPAPGSRRPN